VLLIIDPFSIILGPVYMDINSMAMCFILAPFTIKDVAIGMPELPTPMRLVISPTTLILGSIRPNLNTVAMTLFVLPLSLVDRSIIENVFLFEYNFGVVVFIILILFQNHLLVLRAVLESRLILLKTGSLFSG
jgi:hypothetical protein